MKRAALFLLLLALFVPLLACAGEEKEEAWTEITASLASDEPDPVPAEWLLPLPERGLKANAGLNKRIANILLMSTDEKDLARNLGRTDVMALFSVHLDSGDAAIVALPETRMMELAGLPGEIRLKYVNCFGGPLRVAQTVNEWLGLNVTRYCAVNEEALIRAVDAMGGVRLTLNAAEAEALGMPAGENILTGEQALNYARLRRSGDAWERPRKLMEALIADVRGRGMEQAGTLAEKLLPLIDTNLTSSDVMNLILALLDGGQSAAVRMLSLPLGCQDGAAWCQAALYGDQ